MNGDRPFERFAALGDDPVTIQQLRKLVVGLAVTGKLTVDYRADHDPKDLARRIEEKRESLIAKGDVKKQRIAREVSSEDLPKCFSDPGGFVRLGFVARIEKGMTGIMKARRGPYPLVVTAEERLNCDHYDFDGAAAIVPLVSSAGHGKASLQRLHYQEGKFALGSILAAIFPHAPELLSARFLFEYLTAFKEELLVSRMIGTANVSLSIGKVAEIPIPLVSPLVQRKVDELMALCDRLEAARMTREAIRDQLAASSLDRLNSSDTHSEGWDAHYLLSALPALTVRPDQIKQLRQTVLNLAARGKLVPQDPGDESAVGRLDRATDRAAGPAKKSKPGAISSLELVGEDLSLPASWCWVKLGDLVREMDAGWSPQCENHARTDARRWGVLKTTSVQPLAFDGGQHKELPTKFDPRPQFEAKVGDILVTRAGPRNRVGVTCVVDRTEPRLMISDKLIRFRLIDGLIPEFFALALNAGLSSSCIEKAKSGMAVMQMNISQEKLRAVPVPLPPLAEQARIVTKVGEMLAICNELETKLAAIAETRRHLLNALLDRALAPGDVEISGGYAFLKSGTTSPDALRPSR